MMAHDQNYKPKTMLHELLKEDQEPFHLSKYISHKRSMLRKQTDPKSTLLLPVKRRTASGNNLCRHAACFFTLHSTSPDDVTKSPFIELPSPAINKSPANGAVFLDIPSRIASVLLEAALRIQNPKPRSSHAGFGFGSFLKRLKSKTKKHDLKSTLEQSIHTISSSSTCGGSERKNKSSLSSVGWTESYREDNKSLELEAPSTSSCGSEEDDTANGDFDFPETRFCMSPFVFSLHRSPSPELCSPARSPGRLVIQENENSRNENNEEKEQCSPVSVLDPPIDEEDDENETEEEDDDDDYDLQSSYANVQRAKQQLLQRLQRFERLADLDPIELERKLMLESSDDEGDEGLETFLSENRSTNEVLTLDRPSNLLQHSHSTDHGLKKRLGEKCEIICSRLDSKREVEGLNTIDMMMELDLKREKGEWTKFREEVEETAQELEVSIFDLLTQELI